MKLTIWSGCAVLLLVSGCGESRRNGDPGGEPVSFQVHLERSYVRDMRNQQWTPSGAVAVGAGSNGGPTVSSGLSLSFSATSVYLYGGDKIATADVFVRELKWGDNAFSIPLTPHRQLFLTVKATGGREGYQVVGTVTIPDSPHAAIVLALNDSTRIQVLPLQVEPATPPMAASSAVTTPAAALATAPATAAASAASPPPAPAASAPLAPAAAATSGVAASAAAATVPNAPAAAAAPDATGAAPATSASAPGGAAPASSSAAVGSPVSGTTTAPETLSAAPAPAAVPSASTPPDTRDSHDPAVSAPGAGVNTVGMPATGVTMPSGLAVAPSATPPQPAPAKTLPDPLANPPPPIPPVPPHPDLIPQQ